MDPRPDVIRQRLAAVGRIVAVASGKGGVGKSTVAAGLALALAARKVRAGLLDLDFHGPSLPFLLGAGDLRPTEDRGLIPPLVGGVRLMSAAFYSNDRPLPLRGEAISEALLEILAVTQWGNTEWLVIDLPPGIGEATLDPIRLVEGVQFILVTTPSRLAVKSVRQLVRFLEQSGAPVAGIVMNMAGRDSPELPDLPEIPGVPLLGTIPWDPEIENAVGDPSRLLRTRFQGHLGKLTGKLTELLPARGN